jgi:hypothetical protein
LISLFVFDLSQQIEVNFRRGESAVRQKNIFNPIHKLGSELSEPQAR